ncbi:UMP-CMP kinase 2, mitochondrial [Ascaphus truei]|uniref:UMP-CMP kinase 2, mitochondrial n=1 Tax=Ascaphus truei TaxID=8439 RepID=UPI003F5AC3D0
MALSLYIYNQISPMSNWITQRLCLQLLSKKRAVLANCLRMASSLCHYTADWKSRVFAVDANKSLGYPDPFYFTAYDRAHQLSPAGTSPHVWPMLAQWGSAHSVSITTPHRITAARLQKSLGQQLTRGVLGSCQVLSLFSYLPHDAQGSLQKGFIILDPQNCPLIQSRLKDLLSEYKQHVLFCSYQEGTGSEVWQCLWELDRGQAKEIEISQVVRVGEPATSPFVVNIKNSAVFYSLGDACSVLQECSTIIPEAKNVLDLLENNSTTTKKGEFPVIVIEGLDATGKSTLTQSLKDSLGAVLLKSPPDCISQWRKTFDDEPSLIKRAYYALGNYIVASEIEKASRKSPVIVDRYWHSTAAYAIATEIGGSVHNLPECHHEVYQWPDDLLKPNLVILLTVCDEERMLRMHGRGMEETKEEKELESNSMFRQKVEEAYKRIGNPKCVVVDASSSKQTVLNEALSVIKKHCAI